MNCEYHDRVLSYLNSHGSDDPELEAHIAGCPQCSAMVDGYLEAEQIMTLPQTVYQGSPDALKRRVIKFDKGISRIVIFTIVGLVLGWFSYYYRTIGFWPLKAVIALPYKLSFWIHTLLHHRSDMEIQYGWMYFQNTDFFPESVTATIIAERVTAVLFGGAIYGALAYCTGDKRIFTLQRLMTFLACWTVLIVLTIGLSFGVSTYQINQMETLENVGEMWISPETKGAWTVWRSEEDSDIYDIFYSGLLQDDGIIRERDEEIPVIFTWRNQRETMIILINAEKQYLITRQGTLWRISPEFSQLIAGRDYHAVTEEEGTTND
ncbi:MAG: hypothetical protein AB7D36_00580 [Oscillospiraceae bacterium]